MYYQWQLNLTAFILLPRRLFCLISVVMLLTVQVTPLHLPSFKASFLNLATGSMHETLEDRALHIFQAAPLTPAPLQPELPLLTCSPQSLLLFPDLQNSSNSTHYLRYTIPYFIGLSQITPKFVCSLCLILSRFLSPSKASE